MIAGGTGGRLTVLSGPSGVGKGTVLAALRKAHPEVWVSVSMTTRRPRPGEVHGRHYSFTDDERFCAAVERGELLEHAIFSGHRYGTPRAPVEQRLAAGLPALLEIELQGARQVRTALGRRARLVFLAPPSWGELERRLRGRGTEDPEAVAARLRAAREELAAEEEFDVVLVNVDVGQAAEALVSLLG